VCVCVCKYINKFQLEGVSIIMVIWQVFTLRLELGVTVICLNKEKQLQKTYTREKKNVKRNETKQNSFT